ncbi:type II toxin-antitoxin system RelE/ParE family toxin [Nitrosomonas sp. Nm132]|uniref:type II toxin-antitoxin system RelE/ParE family toxin n=1 Tax=Nitrosomonas sp. Nm132 TaxID=1881053 RepID=UPI00087E4B2E|nr:type II toxin-antitoxin system RelE/ParE family toxin [Nitrosomonas sp. Nm132]SDH25586.1 Phage-related protein [Nitrosomonas sp. Nm132]
MEGCLLYKNLYNDAMVKQIEFISDSLSELRTFPISARREAGFQLDRVQKGFDPDDWKPMKTIGSGVNEIRVRDADGVYRVIYIAKFDETVFVLHCFKKKTEKTAKTNIDLAKSRYKELMRRFK